MFVSFSCIYLNYFLSIPIDTQNKKKKMVVKKLFINVVITQ